MKSSHIAALCLLGVAISCALLLLPFTGNHYGKAINSPLSVSGPSPSLPAATPSVANSALIDSPPRRLAFGNGFGIEATDAQTNFQHLQTLSPQDLLSLWRASFSDPSADQMILQRAFIAVTVKNAAATQGKLRGPFASALGDKTAPAAFKLSLASAYAQAEDLSTVGALLDVITAKGQDDSDLRQAILAAISSVGKNHQRSDIRFPEDISPMLESFASAAAQTGDFALNIAISTALTNVGTSAGVQYSLNLLASELAMNPDSNPPLMQAIVSIRNPDAISPLSNILNQSSPGTPRDISSQAIVQASGKALMNIGTEGSVNQVLSWLKDAPDSEQPLAADWLANLRTPAAKDAVRGFLASNQIASPAIANIARNALSANTLQSTWVYPPGQ